MDYITSSPAGGSENGELGDVKSWDSHIFAGFSLNNQDLLFRVHNRRILLYRCHSERNAMK